jgi:hypothetical protein
LAIKKAHPLCAFEPRATNETIATEAIATNHALFTITEGAPGFGRIDFAVSLMLVI